MFTSSGDLTSRQLYQQKKPQDTLGMDLVSTRSGEPMSRQLYQQKKLQDTLGMDLVSIRSGQSTSRQLYQQKKTQSNTINHPQELTAVAKDVMPGRDESTEERRV
ncbi:hypothetical protein AV530_012165 [Patagioenas fasciata monilis]|uniref:Uncharacterized protein n=1 Tax=Patagioenas fasciata monilis TaxID=372326 RepID=A0A1V4J503_PATFA|nr:hypothetical protein AV530_012165 [Patagioenas fasciata monilis]